MNKKNLQTGFKIFITIGIFWYLFNNYSLIYNFELKNFDYFIYAVGMKSLNIFVIAYINLFAFLLDIRTCIGYIKIVVVIS